MSLLQHLNFRNSNSSTNDASYCHHHKSDDITLGDQIDEGALESYWEKVAADIHADPDWYTFADE